MSRLFGTDFITQKYLRRFPNSERTRSWAGVLVHIETENGVWRTGGSGYTWAGKPDAWILSFEDAVKKIDHCGPEKMGKLLRASLPPPQPREAANADAVNHPAHYGGADNPYEAIKVIEAWNLGFNLGNTVKYISRAGKKDALPQELKKARWYLDREISNLEKEAQR